MACNVTPRIPTFANGTVPLANDETPESVDMSDYLAWKQNFGNVASGGGALSNATNLPEPSTAAAIVIAAVALSGSRRRYARLLTFVFLVGVVSHSASALCPPVGDS